MAGRCSRNSVTIGKWILVALVVLSFYKTIVLRSELPVLLNNVEKDLSKFLYSENAIDQNIFERPPSDSRLISFVKTRLIEQPEPGEYTLTNRFQEKMSRDQNRKIEQFFSLKETGCSFVDIGAGNGEYESISLYFEMQRNCTGLLIEPNKEKYRQLRGKHRKSASINACVMGADSTLNMPSNASFGGNVPCLWIETILGAFDKKTIDILTIDAGGNEIAILKSIPFNKFYIRVIAVELSTKLLPEVSKLFQEMHHLGFVAQHQSINRALEKTDVIFQNEKDVNK